MKARKITFTILTVIIMVTIAFTSLTFASAETISTKATVESQYSTVEPTVEPTESLDPSIPHINSTENTRTGVKIKWSAVDGASKYRVFMKSGSKWKRIGDTKSTNLTHKSVTNNAEYTYTVRCLSSSGNRYTSSYDKAGYTTTYYAAPKLKSVKNTTEGVNFTWYEVDGIDEYRVFVKRSGASKWTNKGVVNTNNYTHASGVSGRKYIYTVRCYKDDKLVSSFDSKGKTITYIAAPQVIKIENARNGAEITWNKVGGAYKYRVFVKSGSKWKKLGDTKSTSFTHDALNNKEYTYTVRCLNKDNDYISAYNKDGYTSTFYTVPKLKNIKNTTDGISLTWGAVDGIDKYQVYVKYNGSSWTKTAIVTGTSYSDTNAESGTKYTYTVRCYKDDKLVSSFDSKGKTITYIAAPVITSAELNEDNTVTLTWDKSDGAYQYRVLVKSGSKWKGVAYTKSNTYTIENLKNNIEYTYTVRCCDKDKNYTSDYVRSNCTFTRNLIIDQEAYTEDFLLYAQVTRAICNKCGADVSGDANGKVGDLDPNYKDSSRKWYHYEIEGCSTAWHTETKWYNKIENRLATIEESDSANNPYLYNETHRDKLERRYKYSAVCTNSDCPDYAKTLFSVTSLYLDSNIKTELRNLLDAHYNENHPTEDTQQGQIDSHQEVWQITSYPEISHYELTVK